MQINYRNLKKSVRTKIPFLSYFVVAAIFITLGLYFIENTYQGDLPIKISDQLTLTNYTVRLNGNCTSFGDTNQKYAVLGQQIDCIVYLSSTPQEPYAIYVVFITSSLLNQTYYPKIVPNIGPRIEASYNLANQGLNNVSFAVVLMKSQNGTYNAISSDGTKDYSFTVISRTDFESRQGQKVLLGVGNHCFCNLFPFYSNKKFGRSLGSKNNET